MAYKFFKYEFTPTEWATYKAQITDTDGNPINCAIVEIGNICLAHDEEGNCTNLSPMYAVDILFYTEPPAEFTPFEVWPNPMGIHTFSGDDNLYLQGFCAKFADSPYCVIPEPPAE